MENKVTNKIFVLKKFNWLLLCGIATFFVAGTKVWNFEIILSR